jgi:hypothetical protein
MAKEWKMPTAHWGTFTKDLAWNYSYQAAADALARNGFTEWGRWDFPGVAGGVIGGKGAAVVQVSFAAESNFTRIAYAVTGVSEDSGQAEAARNNVRDHIVRWHTID